VVSFLHFSPPPWCIYIVFLPMPVTCPTYLIHWDSWVIYSEYIPWCSSLCSFHQSHFTSSSLGPLYLPQHPVPEHILPVLFPKCKKSSLSPIQNKKTRSAFYKQQNCTFELLVVSPNLRCCCFIVFRCHNLAMGWGARTQLWGLLSRATHTMMKWTSMQNEKQMQR